MNIPIDDYKTLKNQKRFLMMIRNACVSGTEKLRFLVHKIKDFVALKKVHDTVHILLFKGENMKKFSKSFSH